MKQRSKIQSTMTVRREGVEKLFLRDNGAILDISEWSPKNKDDCFWVQGEMLRQFLQQPFSPIDDVDSDASSPSVVVLSNGDCSPLDGMICQHGIGLHPSTAQKGKWVTRQVYNVLKQLMFAQKETVKKMDHRQYNEDISFKSKFQCDLCSVEYSSRLQEKLNLLTKLKEADELLDPSGIISISSDDEVRNSLKPVCMYRRCLFGLSFNQSFYPHFELWQMNI